MIGANRCRDPDASVPRSSPLCHPYSLLERAGRLGGAAGPEAGGALLAIPLLLAVLGEPVADPNPAGAARAVEQDVRDVDRHLLREPAPLLALGARLEVLVDPVDPLD